MRQPWLSPRCSKLGRTESCRARLSGLVDTAPLSGPEFAPARSGGHAGTAAIGACAVEEAAAKRNGTSIGGVASGDLRQLYRDSAAARACPDGVVLGTRRPALTATFAKKKSGWDRRTLVGRAARPWLVQAEVPQRAAFERFRGSRSGQAGVDAVGDGFISSTGQAAHAGAGLHTRGRCRHDVAPLAARAPQCSEKV
jgi:hypothetical protein